MRDQSSTRPRAGARLALCAALMTALLAAAPAAADTGRAAKAAGATPTRPTPAAADEHSGMTADEHAGMQPADTSEGAPAGHGGHDAAGAAADEHAGMQPADKSEGAPEGHGGHDAGGAADRPVGLLLGGFGALNGLVLIAAAVLRRRGPAAKRRATLARVRASAGAATVPRAPTVEHRS
jgi:hypothetical protein